MKTLIFALALFTTACNASWTPSAEEIALSAREDARDAALWKLLRCVFTVTQKALMAPMSTTWLKAAAGRMKVNWLKLTHAAKALPMAALAARCSKPHC